MTQRPGSSRPTHAQRLLGLSPSAYAFVGPPARAVRRELGLASDTVQSWRFCRRIVGSPGGADARDAKVVLDGVAFQEGSGGIARVWRSVLAEWSESGFADDVAIVDRDGTAPRHSGFRYVSAPRAHQPHARAHARLLQCACDSVRAQVFISTGYTHPLTTPSVLMLHDMTPEVLGWDLGQPAWREKREAIEYATSFVSVSRNTLVDARHYYPQVEGKPALVAPNGIDAVFRPASTEHVAELRARLDLPEHYFVLVGRREGYKNGFLLFKALQILSRPDVGVLAVGGAPTLESESAKLAGDVPVRLARLSDADLAVAYSGAAALVYTSRYEGFGLPVAEAMACGCPVITCRNSSLPEVGGNAAIYVGEDDPAALAAALDLVIEPAERAARARAGIEQAAQFSWGRSAGLITDALLRIVVPS